MEEIVKMSDQPVINARGLTRYFGAKAAVEDLNLTVPRGCVFAFLGRNGSGKTTTIRMLLGLLEPTRGGGTILGDDIRALPVATRARIGYLTEEHQLYSWMSVKECGEFQSRFYPRWNSGNVSRCDRSLCAETGGESEGLVTRRTGGVVPGADPGAGSGIADSG